MAEVGRVTPGKPIWPGHHGGELAVDRVTPSKDEEQGKKRKPAERGTTTPPGPDDDTHGHVDEYV